MPQILRDTKLLHPILREAHSQVQQQVIEKHRAPFRLFETGRLIERQASLVRKGKAPSLTSRHFFRIDTEPKVLSTAIVYVFYSGRWSWDLRSATVKAWYQLFGELVLDLCPDLFWGGYRRNNVDYTYFEIRQAVLNDKGVVTLNPDELQQIKEYLEQFCT